MHSNYKLHESQTGILFVSVSAILWGTVGIATQAIYQQSELTAVTVGFYRLALAFPVVALLCWKIVGQQIFQVSTRQHLKMMLIGIMLALYQVFFFAAIGYIGVAVATLVTLCTAPVLVSLASAVVLKEKLTGYNLLALLAALLGTVMLIGLPENAASEGRVALGIALALGSATGYAIVAMLGRSIASSCHPIHSATISFGTGAIFLFPLATTSIFSASYTDEIWGLILFVGIVPTAVAYSLFFLGMRSLKASTASIITMLEPLTATILAWLIFDERLATSGLIGAILLLSAMAILYQGEKRLRA